MAAPGTQTFPLATIEGSEALAAEPQVAALCWRKGAQGHEILLINSLHTGRWLLPKGWVDKGLGPAQSALCEAWEEAGIRGEIEDKPLGHYHYRKRRRGGVELLCRVIIYPVRVTAVTEDWPEKARRVRLWVSPQEAAEKVLEPELAEILRNLTLP